MTGGSARPALLFIESNTSGTGRLFVQAAREIGYRPVLVTARPAKYAYLAEDGAPEVVVVPRVDEDELHGIIAQRFDGGRDDDHLGRAVLGEVGVLRGPGGDQDRAVPD
ncbi:MAG TPA: hypothetical protein VFR81_26185, partial [Longimicrobium sp.]|nr:hypothetical protein [Longimicrobium sp.]